MPTVAIPGVFDYGQPSGCEVVSPEALTGTFLMMRMPSVLTCLEQRYSLWFYFCFCFELPCIPLTYQDRGEPTELALQKKDVSKPLLARPANA